MNIDFLRGKINCTTRSRMNQFTGHKITRKTRRGEKSMGKCNNYFTIGSLHQHSEDHSNDREISELLKTLGAPGNGRVQQRIGKKIRQVWQQINYATRSWIEQFLQNNYQQSLKFKELTRMKAAKCRKISSKHVLIGSRENRWIKKKSKTTQNQEE